MIKVVALLLWLSCHVMGRTAQFCTGEEGVNSCFAVDTAGLDDDTVRIVASIHFPSATGWAALGAGTRMSDAVMFVVALNADKSDVLVSARTTPSGHAAPQEAPALMDKLETHPSARGPNDTYIVDFTCHACDIQEPAAWLWATNPSQPLASSDFNAALEMHATFGRFALNPATTLDADPDPTFPSRESFGITPLSAHPASSSYALFIAHGTLMSLAFLLLFPLGALAIRHPSPSAFPRHWRLQAAAALCVLCGAALALSRVLAHRTLWESFRKPHHGIGQVLTVAVVVQGVLGWLHHRAYVRLGRRTGVSGVHVWLGRAVVMAGMGNVAFGASFKHWMLGSEGGTWIAVGVVAGVWGVAWVWVGRGARVEQQVGTEEQSYELLGEGEREEDGREGPRKNVLGEGR